ncbi:hypothetical protein ACWGK1_20285 [Streptomyces wedmorensis]
MIEPTGAVAAKTLSPLTRMAQESANPLVAVKHGRREDRAAVYDRFIAVCITYYTPQGDENESNVVVRDADVHELFAALYALELRAPRHVRDAARKLFWGILGEFAEGGTLDERAEEFDYRAVWQGLDDDEATGSSEATTFSRSATWYRPWLVGDVPEPFRPGNGQRRRFHSSFELLREISCFTAIARVDVQNRWRWWHWPTAIIPPLRRWMLAR